MRFVVLGMVMGIVVISLVGGDAVITATCRVAPILVAPGGC